jgi:hypothetical protein
LDSPGRMKSVRIRGFFVDFHQAVVSVCCLVGDMIESVICRV